MTLLISSPKDISTIRSELMRADARCDCSDGSSGCQSEGQATNDAGEVSIYAAGGVLQRFAEDFLEGSVA